MLSMSMIFRDLCLYIFRKNEARLSYLYCFWLYWIHLNVVSERKCQGKTKKELSLKLKFISNFGILFWWWFVYGYAAFEILQRLLTDDQWWWAMMSDDAEVYVDLLLSASRTKYDKWPPSREICNSSISHTRYLRTIFISVWRMYSSRIGLWCSWLMILRMMYK